jgi:hypothetical protein
MCGSARCRGTMDANPERIKDAGRRVRVYWEQDGQWYEGRVLCYSPTTDKHTIYYPEAGEALGQGSKESVVLAEVAHEWLDEPFPQPEEAARQLACSRDGAHINPLTNMLPGRQAAEACVSRLHQPWPDEPPGVLSAAGDVANAAAMLPQAAEASSERIALPTPLPPPQADSGLELLSSVAANMPPAATAPIPVGAPLCCLPVMFVHAPWSFCRPVQPNLHSFDARASPVDFCCLPCVHSKARTTVTVPCSLVQAVAHFPCPCSDALRTSTHRCHPRTIWKRPCPV